MSLYYTFERKVITNEYIRDTKGGSLLFCTSEPTYYTGEHRHGQVHFTTDRLKSLEAIRLSRKTACGLLLCTLMLFESYLFGYSPLAFMLDELAAYSCQLIIRDDMQIHLESFSTILFNSLV